MNKQLIEKWKASEVAIITPYISDYLGFNKLAKLLEIDMLPYLYGKYVFKVNGVACVNNNLPEGMTAVPFSQFFENEKQPTSQPMKPYIEYLAEESGVSIEDINTALVVGKDEAQAAADKFAEDRMVAFSIWCSDNQWEITIDGKIWVKIIKQKPVYKTTSELIAIFNSETK